MPAFQKGYEMTATILRGNYPLRAQERHEISCPDLRSIPLRKILVPTDFSAGSYNALQQAVSIAKHYGSVLEIVHVITPLSFIGCPELLPDLIAMATQNAKQMIEVMEPGTKVSHSVEIGLGIPASVILEMAAQRQTDLIVIGTHGRRGLGKLCLGSVAEEVFHRAQCPVLTVGPNAHVSLRELSAGDCIVMAFDDSDTAAVAASHAALLAKSHDAELVSVHLDDRLLGRPCKVQPGILQALQHRLHVLIEHVASVPPKVNVVMDFGPPEEAILRIAARRQARFIVLGVGGNRLTRRNEWRSAYDIVCGASCPVITVRAN
jgi:nucleotide-binding universal stress UspA family protein